MRPVEYGWFPSGMVPLVSGTRHSPASSLTPLTIGVLNILCGSCPSDVWLLHLSLGERC